MPNCTPAAKYLRFKMISKVVSFFVVNCDICDRFVFFEMLKRSLITDSQLNGLILIFVHRVASIKPYI